MRRFLVVVLFLAFRCASPAPAPNAVPEPAPVAVTQPAAERVIRTASVTASELNVRKEASGDAEVVEQVKRGTMLDVLADGDSWTKVRLADGRVGWVASRFVAEPGRVATRSTTSKQRPGAGKGRSGCPADSDYAFVETPTPRFSDSGAHGIVVVEANVNVQGKVTSTKLISNGTGDEALAFLTEKEIRSAKFSPPIRNCVPRAFIFTYRRTF
jgi:uncharacterized protein YgiM (DUF1202 family)